MRRGITLAVIIFVSFVVALVVTPADPITYYIYAAGILCVAIPSYLVGLRHGRIHGETPGNTVVNGGGP